MNTWIIIYYWLLLILLEYIFATSEEKIHRLLINELKVSLVSSIVSSVNNAAKNEKIGDV